MCYLDQHTFVQLLQVFFIFILVWLLLGVWQGHVYTGITTGSKCVYNPYIHELLEIENFKKGITAKKINEMKYVFGIYGTVF